MVRNEPGSLTGTQGEVEEFTKTKSSTAQLFSKAVRDEQVVLIETCCHLQ